MSGESTPREPVELMGEVLEAFNRRDVDTVMGFFAADAVFDSRVLGNCFEGQAAIRAFVEDWLGAFEEWTVEPQEIIELGNGVVFLVYRQQGRPVGSSGRIGSRVAAVYEWADAVVTRATTHASTAEARAAAGRLVEERE
jgi:ketosteroid isomerase-like protein